jgi:hypothetical protein
MGILSALYFCRDHDFSGGVPTKGDSKYDAVMALPDGIEVTHTPDKVYAEEGGGRSGRRYTLNGIRVRMLSLWTGQRSLIP